MSVQQVVNSYNGSSYQNAPAPAVVRQAVETPSQVTAPTVQVAADAVKATKGPLDMNQVKNATEKVNKVVQAINSDLQFIVDEDTGMNVVKVVDNSTKSVIRQFPSEEILAIAKGIDQLQGLLIRQKA